MMNFEQFRHLFPKIYTDCAEVNTFSLAQWEMLQLLNEQYLHLQRNSYLLTADSDGLAEYEKVLNIPVDLTEDIEFRRERILERLKTLPPFTMNYLRQRLDDFIGAGAWEAYIDFDAYTLYVEAFVRQKWYHELQVMMNMIKPANIVFINSPLTPSTMALQEISSNSIIDWNYILGTWKIDETTPFAYYDNMGVFHMATEPSITTYLLNKTASDIANSVDHIVLTGDGQTKVVNVLDHRYSDNNLVVLGYRVYPDHISHIEHISVQDAANNELLTFDTDLYILVDNFIKHVVSVEENLDE